MAMPKPFYQHINPKINTKFLDLNPDKDEVWKVYNLYFTVAMAKKYTLDEKEIALFGIATTGDEDEDEAELNRGVLVKRTISQIAMIRSKGIKVELAETEQSVIVYELIKATLLKIHTAISGEIVYNTTDYPMDEITRLDELATELWPQARFYYTAPPEAPSILGAFPERNTILKRRVLLPKTSTAPIIPETHVPIAPLIAGKLKLRSK